MANNSSTKVKGVAIAKRAKIDKAQSIMLGAVCGASLILGITIVGIIYFVKTISYNGKLIDQVTKAASSYETVQKNLKSVAEGVRALGANKDLESVASTARRQECSSFDVNEKITPDNIGTFRTCSALRVVPETVPVPTTDDNSKISAALGSMQQLLEWSAGGKGVNFEGIAQTNAKEVFKDVFHSLGVSVRIDDEAWKVKSALETVEASIRNYDLQVSSIRFGNRENKESGEKVSTIEFSGTYSTYYSDKVNVETTQEILCADPDNDKCPGDTLSNGGSTKKKSKKKSSKK